MSNEKYSTTLAAMIPEHAVSATMFVFGFDALKMAAVARNGMNKHGLDVWCMIQRHLHLAHLN